MSSAKISAELCNQYRKMGGWLLFLIIGQSIGVIFGFANMVVDSAANGTPLAYNSIDLAFMLFRIVSLVVLTYRVRRAREIFVSRVVFEMIVHVAIGLYSGSASQLLSAFANALAYGVTWIPYLYLSTRVKVYLGLIENDEKAPYAETQIVFSENISDYANDNDSEKEERIKILEKMKSQAVNGDVSAPPITPQKTMRV